MKEMQEFREAVNGWRDTSANLIDHQKTMKKKARRVIAALFLDAGRDGFDWIKQGMTPLIQSGLQVDSLLRDEIAAIQRERAEAKQAAHDAEMERKIQDHNEKIAAIVREAKENAEDLSDPEVYLKRLTPISHLTAEDLQDAPLGAIIQHQTDQTAKYIKWDIGWVPTDGIVPVGVLPGGWRVLKWGEDVSTPPSTPQPGDRLTTGQMKDAPDGTVVEDFINPLVHYTKRGNVWTDGVSPPWGSLEGGHILVRWGHVDHE